MKNLLPTRRDFCTASALFAAHIASSPVARATTTPISKTLADDVAHYVKLGEHRVGTKGEHQTAQWLQQRLTALSYTTRLDRFAVKTILEPQASVQIGDFSVTGFPQWLPPQQSLGKTFTGPLFSIDDPQAAAGIRIVTKPIPFAANWTPKLDEIVKEAKAKNATALIMTIDHSAEGLFVSNQHSHDSFPIPVILVAKRDLTELAKRVPSPAENASVRVDGQQVEAQSINVVARKNGVGKTIVLSTPLTGWFHCGGERGPGIALWLHAAAQLAKTPRPIVLLGTGSHEVGHFGMDHALLHAAPKPDEVALWVHFGASLGATKLDAQFKFRSPQALIARPASEGFAKTHLSANLPIYVSGNKTTLGEAGQVIAAGHENFVGMSGFFPGFHTKEDLGEAIDFDALEKLSNNVQQMLDQIKV
jgi:hypothetical protein